MLVFATFRVEDLQYGAGAPTIHASSTHGTREFCHRCGTQIAYRPKQDAAFVDVNVGALENPAACTPEYHIWTENRVPWLNISDDLPRFEREKPEHA